MFIKPFKIKLAQKKFDGDFNDHCFINANIYMVTKSFLQANIEEIEKNKNSEEFYFADIILIIKN